LTAIQQQETSISLTYPNDWKKSSA